jgi:hypothetical protein
MMQLRSGARRAALAMAAFLGAAAGAQDGAPGAPHDMAAMGGMQGHMRMSAPRAAKPGDAERAATVVAAAKAAMEPYRDYHKALADGFRIFLPNIRQPQYHFTKYANGRLAHTSFDPSKPTSLLYRKTADGGYELVGAMYTDRVDASEDELDTRIPLSVARWHQHVNFCKAPPGQFAAYFGPDAKFGLLGSIDTPADCAQAGGTFIPHVLGWMVHVYPYEADPAQVWRVDSDEHGHDNMAHSAMPGMDMNDGAK